MGLAIQFISTTIPSKEQPTGMIIMCMCLYVCLCVCAYVCICGCVCVCASVGVWVCMMILLLLLWLQTSCDVSEDGNYFLSSSSGTGGIGAELSVSNNMWE